MNWQLLKRAALVFVVMLVTVPVLYGLLFIKAMIPSSQAELFPNELLKDYVLTENLVLTSTSIDPPGPFRPRQKVAFTTTSEYYNRLKSLNFGPTNPFPLPNLGEVHQGKRVEVTEIFTYKNLTANVRYGKFQFTDIETRERLTAYGVWEDVSPKLKEVQ